MTGRGVVDRIEGETAVVLVGEDETEYLVPVQELPTGGGPGVWLVVEVEGARLRLIAVDQELTARRQTLARELKDRLRRPTQG